MNLKSGVPTTERGIYPAGTAPPEICGGNFQGSLGVPTLLRTEVRAPFARDVTVPNTYLSARFEAVTKFRFMFLMHSQKRKRALDELFKAPPGFGLRQSSAALGRL